MQAEEAAKNSDGEERSEMVLQTKGGGIVSSIQIHMHTSASYSHAFCVCIIKPNKTCPEYLGLDQFFTCLTTLRTFKNI